jgi:alkylation response protein AidB-like acyl-CoA dehydrogenase
MDFELNDDQVALAEGVRALVHGRFDLETVRRAEGAGRTFEAAAWLELGRAGVFSLTLPEAAGGVGLGLADAAVVFEELGRALVPGPLVATALAAGLVEGAATGTAAAGLLVGGGPHLPVLVEHLGALDALLVLTEAGVLVVDGAELADVTAAAARIDEPLDPLTPLWRPTGAVPPGRPAADRATSARLAHEGAVLTAALQVGHAAETVTMAVAYAKERQQFGRPIGSFQAIKHLCADMLTRAEVARCAVHAAACLADQPEAVAVGAAAGDGSPADVLRRAAAGAKLMADEAAVANARTAIQVYGGMGFTWEVPLHLHLKRSLVLATTFGTPSDRAEQLAGLL